MEENKTTNLTGGTTCSTLHMRGFSKFPPDNLQRCHRQLSGVPITWIHNTMCGKTFVSKLETRNDLAKIRPENLLSLISGGWEEKKGFVNVYIKQKETNKHVNSFLLMEKENTAILSLNLRVTEDDESFQVKHIQLSSIKNIIINFIFLCYSQRNVLRKLFKRNKISFIFLTV